MLAPGGAVLEVLLDARVVDGSIAAEALEKIDPDEAHRGEDEDEKNKETAAPPRGLLRIAESVHVGSLYRSRVAVCREGFESGAGRSGSVAADSSGKQARRLS